MFPPLALPITAPLHRLTIVHRLNRASILAICLARSHIHIFEKPHTQGQRQAQFTFDRVFGGNAPQDEIYEYAARPIVEGALSLCLLALEVTLCCEQEPKCLHHARHIVHARLVMISS